MFVYTTHRGVVRRAPAAARVGEGVHGQAGAGLPRHRHRRRRPRAVARSASSTSRRGSPPRAATASSPRPRTAPTSRPGGSTPAAGSADGSIGPVATLNGTLTAIPRTDRRDPRDPPAGRRLGPGPGGAAALPRRARGAEARDRVSDWQPGLVALDIDGTLLKWVEGVGTTYEQIPDGDPRRRTPGLRRGRPRRAGQRSLAARHDPDRRPARPAAATARDRLWVVASNGAVVFRYPPLEVVHEEIFDARPAVEAVLRERPSALVAVEERGVGYRVNRPFPDGELSGELIETDGRRPGGRPRQPRDHPRPRRDRRRLRRARAPGSACTAPTTSSAGPRGSTSRRSASPRRPGSRWSPSSSASRRPTCSRSATAATTSRCCAGPAAASPWASRSRRSGRPPTHVTDTVYDDGVVVELCPLVPGVSESFTFTAPLWRWSARARDRRPVGVDASSPLPPEHQRGGARCAPGEPRGFGSVRVSVQVGQLALGHQRVPRRRGLGVLRAAGQEGGPDGRGRRARATTSRSPSRSGTDRVSLPERIETERLRLILVTPADAADMRAGRRQERWHPSYPRRDDVDAASMVRAGDDDPGGRATSCSATRPSARIGCFGAPEDGETEVGFGLVPEVRGQGVATEALRGLLAGRPTRSAYGSGPASTPTTPPASGCSPAAASASCAAAPTTGELVLARPLPAADVPAPRLVATDLDGTLLRTDGVALRPLPRRARRPRPPRRPGRDRDRPADALDGRPAGRSSGQHGLAIVSNGAAVFDVGRRRGARRARASRPAAGLELVRRIRGARCRAPRSPSSRCAGIALAPGLRRHRAGPRGQPRRRRSTSSGPSPALKLLVRHPDADHERLRRGVDRGGRRPRHPDLVDAGPGRDQRRRRHQGDRAGARSPRSSASTAADVVAFGDMPNDVPMLTWAGTSYAMGNAHPDAARGRRPRGADQRRRRRAPRVLGWPGLRRLPCDL